MPLMVWLALATAHATGTAVFLGSVQDARPPAETRAVPYEALAPQADWNLVDESAWRTLVSELREVRPLMHEFDGELAIMARLEVAAGRISYLRGEQERRALYEALVFQGFAVQRYFQSTLATDPEADPFRVWVGDRYEVRPWVDAIALDPHHEPTRDDLSELPELEALRQVRARLLFADRAEIEVRGLPEEAEVVVNGVRLVPDAAGRLKVLPGRHRVATVAQGRIVARHDVRLEPGERWWFVAPPDPLQLDLLVARLAALPAEEPLPPGVALSLGAMPQPVWLAVPQADGTVFYRIRDDVAVRVEPEDNPRGGQGATPALGTWLGAALVHDPAWDHLLGPGDQVGAAVSPSFGLSLAWSPLPHLQAGGGLDLFVPVGPLHEVPGHDGAWVRLRMHPHLFVGHPAAQLTLGELRPWHRAVGVRGALPLWDEAALSWGLVQGFGAGAGRPEALGSASPPRAAWLGLQSHLGR